MEKIIIGRATIEYNLDGIVTSAKFDPMLDVNLGPEILSQLTQIKNGSQDELQSNSDFILGTFFSKMTEIELADRNLFVVKSKVVDCVKYVVNSSVAKCVLEYTFEERKEVLN